MDNDTKQDEIITSNQTEHHTAAEEDLDTEQAPDSGNVDDTNSLDQKGGTIEPIADAGITELNSQVETAEKRLVELKSEAELLQKSISRLEQDFKKKNDALQAGYSTRKEELDSLIKERKKAIMEIDVERTSLVEKVSSILDDLLKDTGNASDGFSDIYKKATDATRLQLKAALADANVVTEALVAFGKELQTQSESHAKALIEKREDAHQEIVAWRENELSEIDTEINDARKANREKEKELSDLRAKLEQDKENLRVKESAIESAISRGVELGTRDIVAELKFAQEELEKRDNEVDGLQIKLDEAKRTIRDTEAAEKRQLQQQISHYEQEIEELQKKTNAEYLQSEILTKANNYDILKEEFDSVNEDKVKLEIENTKLSRLPELSSVITDLMKQGGEKIDELKEQLEKLKGDDYSAEFRQRPITGKPCFTKDYTDNGQTDELSWLESISEGVSGEGFVFSKRMISAFHTCIKTAIWSPVTVLAGVSGTGKSELPRLYSQYGGLVFMNTPVKPDWDSPSSMLGYYNALERKFESRPILRAMYQLQNNDASSPCYSSSLINNLGMFLLDEMNLAHVELYFSDMLSKLEENRNKTASEPAKLEIDLGAGIDVLQIDLTRNMFWVGTMNEDETTKGLSDKVVDRSNIIVFPRPKQLVSRPFQTVPDNTALLSRGAWETWQMKHITLCNNDGFHKTTEPYNETIALINEKLEFGGRALGYRVWQSIEHYMAAHPLVINNITDNMEIETKYLDAAFAEAVAFKVMPKLRGIETEGNTKKDCLNPIGDIINDKVSSLYTDYNNALTSPYGIFVWKSGEFLTKEID